MSLTSKILLLCLTTTLALAHSGDFHDALVTADQATSDTAHCDISIEGDKRVIESNGIPQHLVGAFPNRGNPHTITEQHYHYEVPANPEVATQATPLVRQPFGVALNGVPFDPGTAEYYQRDRDSEWNYEALSGEVRLGLDENHAHVQPNGAYHYHGLPTALFDELSQGKEQMTLLGWAADGFPLYGIYGYTDANDARSAVTTLKSSYRVKSGKRPSGNDSPSGDYDGTFTIDYEYVAGLGDLDECGGRVGVTPEFPDGTYYYVLTDDYPFIPRMFRGTPDPSFERRRGGGPNRMPPRNGPPPARRGPRF
jgi:hypothetical protein